MQTGDTYFWQSVSVGGTGGGAFTDLTAMSGDGQTQLIQAASLVKTITARAGGSYVTSVQLVLDSGALPTHGGSDGGAKTLTLAANEYISAVDLWVNTNDGKPLVFGLKFSTNLNHTIEVGKQTGTKTTINIPSSHHVVGLYGRSGSAIDQLGVIATRVFD